MSGSRSDMKLRGNRFKPLTNDGEEQGEGNQRAHLSGFGLRLSGANAAM